MRTIPAAAQAILDQEKGAEPIVVLEVQWSGSSATAGYYADKTIAGTPVVGRILEAPGLDEVVQISGGGQAQQFPVTLDDHDGAIKALAFDTYDPHKKTVKVWQYLEGTDFDADKFLLFRGQINSLVSWDEGQRTVSFAIVSRVEDKEVGFSAEEGNFPLLPEELIGKPWPLCFGTVVHVPCLKAVPAVNGRLATGVGIKDFTLSRRIELAEAITCPQTPVGFKCTAQSAGISYNAVCDIAYEEDVNCLQQRCVELERLKLQYAEQASYEYATIKVFGGENFPQGKTITLNINGGKFTGKFQGTKANPSTIFAITDRRHPKDDGTGQVITDPLEEQVKSLCPGAEEAGDSETLGTGFGDTVIGLRESRLSWEAFHAAKEAGFFWAGGGSTVTLDDGNEIIYIANILPSTVLRVAAWRTLNGNRFLLTVPEEFYTIRETDYSGYNVVEIVFDRPLSLEQEESGGGWSDDIYVSLTSSVGPNTVDILRWFIETYTEYGIDSTSFDAVELLVENYPMHFALLERKNLLAVLQEIARLGRCALWMKDDTFYLKYLPEEPTPVATITEEDILEGTLKMELTKTEDLVTKYTAKWRRDYSLGKDNTLILRHNLKTYGTHEKTDDYYVYNLLSLVRKSATYWLIRWANTWKKVKFSTRLQFLALEPFDAITLDLPDVADAPFIGIVERAVYDSNTKRIDFEVWTPILAGTRTPYNFAWPAAIAEKALFPSRKDRATGKAGSGTEPNFSSVAPPGHPLRTEQTGLFQGAHLACNGATVTNSATGECRPDHGDVYPSDVGDVKPEVPVIADSTGAISGGTSPVTNGAGTGFFSVTNITKETAQYGQVVGGKGRENAQRAVDSGSADSPITQDMRDMLNNLPDADDLDADKYPCQVRVKISGFKLSQITIGGNPICLSSSPIFEETIVFNSCEAAQAFKAGFPGQTNCTTTFPCTQCVTVTITGCGCEPPEGQEPAIIGYKNSLGKESHSFFD